MLWKAERVCPGFLEGLCTHSGAVASTILTELTGNPIAAQQALCHLDLSATMRHYIKTKRSVLAEGIQMLDERLSLSK